MAQTSLPTARQIVVEATDGYGRPNGISIKFVCPHQNCRAFAQHVFGEIVDFKLGQTGVDRKLPNALLLLSAVCMACEGVTLWADGILIYPSSQGDAPSPAEDMPPGITEDYAEAGRIYESSPRGAAALLRLCVQKLLAELGVNSRDIDKGIGQLVAAHRVDADVQQAADSLRIIGNEAVHPGTMDLKDDVETALGLFHMLNYLVERTITYPKRAAALFGSLPKTKQDAVAKRDAPQN